MKKKSQTNGGIDESGRGLLPLGAVLMIHGEGR